MLCNLSLKSKQQNIYVHQVYVLKFFLKLRNPRDTLLQGKQYEQVSTKECSEGIYFNFIK